MLQHAERRCSSDNTLTESADVSIVRQRNLVISSHIARCVCEIRDGEMMFLDEIFVDATIAQREKC